MSLTAYVLCILRLFRLKTESQTLYTKPQIYKPQIKIYVYPGLF